MLACGALMGAGAAGAAGNPAAGTDQKYTALQDGIPHPTDGCGGALIVTPRPGTQFADPIGGTPESVTAFYAKAARLDMTWASAAHCIHTGLVHWPASNPGRDGTNAVDRGRSSDVVETIQTGTAWAGYQINNLSHYVQSGWTIPTVTNPPPGHHYSNNGYFSSIWAGMGGGSGSSPSDLPLLQAGSTQNIAGSTTTYYFWYEIVGGSADTGSEMQVSVPASNPGDDVGIAVLWFDDTHTTEFGICDYSVGGCAQYTLNCPGNGICSEEPGAATTEWMVEAPSNGYGNKPLADFDQVDFYNGCWSPDSDLDPCYAIAEPGITNPTAYWLYRFVDGSNQLLAKPGGISSGSNFTVTYFPPNNP
jgi:hypothetical protein